MTNVIYYIETNVICIITLVLILGSLPRGKAQEEYRSERGRYYKMLLRLIIIMSVADLVSGVYRGATFAGARTLLWISNGVYLAIAAPIGCVWVMYTMEVLTGRQNKIIKSLAIALAALDVMLVASAPLNGWIFTIDANNLYHRGSLVTAHWALSYAFELIPLVVAPFTKAGKREKQAIIIYVLLPAVACVLQSMFYGVTAVQAGLTEGAVLIYVLLHNEEINEAKLREKLLNEASNTDALTGLNNRRAYETALESLAAEEWVGVVFMDLNGLKTVNDNEGHKAGDELICRFAGILKRYFKPENIFRISGDEFVIISTDHKDFETRYSAMKDALGDLASAGCTSEPGKNITGMVNRAEKLMYEDKSRYYVRSGKDRRER